MRRYKAPDQDEVLKIDPPFPIIDMWVRVRELKEEITKRLESEEQIADIHCKVRHAHTDEESDSYIAAKVTGSPDLYFVAHHPGNRIGVYHLDELDLLYPTQVERIYRGLQLIMMFHREEASGFSAEYDEIFVDGPEPSELSAQINAELDWLGWSWDEEYECWHSFT